MGGQLCCQSKRDHLIGSAGSVGAANRAGYWKRHPAAERFDVEGVPLTTTALNLDWYHKPQGLLVTNDAIAWVMPDEISLEIPVFHPADAQSDACFSRETHDFHAMGNRLQQESSAKIINRWDELHESLKMWIRGNDRPILAQNQNRPAVRQFDEIGSAQRNNSANCSLVSPASRIKARNVPLASSR